MKREHHFDVIIVGGGMVGATAAVQFALKGKKVFLIEQHPPQSNWLDKEPLRVSAINRFSQDYLEQLGIWPFIKVSSRCQFTQLATWENINKKVIFDCQEVGQSHLGHIIRNEAIQLAAYQKLNELSEFVVINDQVIVKDLIESENRVELMVESQHEQLTMSADLIIGADGATSKIRQFAGIGITGWDYQQHCLSITIATDFAEQDITWQEFQASGPKAFLPLSDGYACLIWYDSPQKVSQLLALSNDELKKQVVETFPALPGDFQIKNSAKFPLTRRQANHYVSRRVVLVGDAAHTINPLAGQGVNLGLKDVYELATLLENVKLVDGERLRKTLLKYQRNRKADALIMSSAMDAFYFMFSNDDPLLRTVRNIGLNLAQKSGIAKKQVLKKAMGY